jgi:hypothetical protein
MHIYLADSGWKRFIDRLRRLWQGPPLQVPLRVRIPVPLQTLLRGSRLR